MDALSLHEAGLYSVCSVPNGASKGSQKLEYLDNCWEYFKLYKINTYCKMCRYCYELHGL